MRFQPRQRQSIDPGLLRGCKGTAAATQLAPSDLKFVSIDALFTSFLQPQLPALLLTSAKDLLVGHALAELLQGDWSVDNNSPIRPVFPRYQHGRQQPIAPTIWSRGSLQIRQQLQDAIGLALEQPVEKLVAGGHRCGEWAAGIRIKPWPVDAPIMHSERTSAHDGGEAGQGQVNVDGGGNGLLGHGSVRGDRPEAFVPFDPVNGQGPPTRRVWVEVGPRLVPLAAFTCQLTQKVLGGCFCAVVFSFAGEIPRKASVSARTPRIGLI
jgi:hypothetical protein